MRVTVRVFGELSTILGRRHSLELDDGTTVGNLASWVAYQAGMKRHGYLGNYKIGGKDLAILVNGRNIDLLEGVETILRHGDEVVFLVPTMGG